MDYLKHYNAIIERARFREVDGHTESHHVIPRCMGGSDGKANRVNLTPEEHYLAHQLLVRIYPEILGLVIAAATMARDNRNGKRSNNKLYGWLRRLAAEAASVNGTGKRRSEAAKARIREGIANSQARRDYYESRKGKPRSEETRNKISESAKKSEAAKVAREKLAESKIGVPRSEETKRKISAHFAGKKRSEEHKKAISESLTGKKKAAEHVAKVSAALAGNQNARGATRSPETRERMRIAAKRREEAKRNSRNKQGSPVGGPFLLEQSQ